MADQSQEEKDYVDGQEEKDYVDAQKLIAEFGEEGAWNMALQEFVHFETPIDGLPALIDAVERGMPIEVVVQMIPHYLIVPDDMPLIKKILTDVQP